MSQKTNSFFTAKNAHPNHWVETFKTILYALVFAILFRSFLYEPFHIPSGSMKNNLLVGDYLFVSKFSYGYSRFSFPLWFKLLPIHDRIWKTEPKRGDIVVFNPPGQDDMGDVYIKRLIGMPGDRLQVKEGVVYINDIPVKKEYAGEWTDTDEPHKVLKRYHETLPEGKSFYTLNNKDSSELEAENTQVYTIPEKHYFMMGDNRDNSKDSRFIGTVPEENLVGRAELIFFSWACFPLCKDRFFVNLN